MKILNTRDNDFIDEFSKFEKMRFFEDKEIESLVWDILCNIRDRGDEALIEYTYRFDKIKLDQKELLVDQKEIKKAYNLVEESIIEDIKIAIDRIKDFHLKQKQNSWIFTEPCGNILGQIARPLERIGVYVPGGKASYPSTVYMNIIPALIAGVNEIVLVTPSLPDKTVNPYVLVTADILGVSEIYSIGGAQAVASLAYGTESIPKVDKIVGPGNIYVTLAKKLVFGKCDIDMLAGPSEILVIADDNSNHEFISADLLSQAEHDERAISMLITPSSRLSKAVENTLYKQLKDLQRQDILEKSIEKNCIIIITKDLNEAIDMSNKIAPEHLEISVENPFILLPKIKNAGSIFLGYYTTEALGDYILGPNHVLPTSGTARFSSPLGVADFIKFSGISYCSKEGLKQIGKSAINIANIEGLEAHALSINQRIKN